MRDAFRVFSLKGFCCQLLVQHVLSYVGFLGLTQTGIFVYRSLCLDCGAVLRSETFLVVAKFEIIFLLIISGWSLGLRGCYIWTQGLMQFCYIGPINLNCWMWCHRRRQFSAWELRILWLASINSETFPYVWWSENDTQAGLILLFGIKPVSKFYLQKPVWKHGTLAL